MTDNWDDGSDDEWDVDDDALDAKLGLKKEDNDTQIPKFDDEQDMALVEKAAAEKANQADLKKKGSALAAKKLADKEREEEEEMARKQMEYEEEMMAHMTPDERKIHERKREEAADLAMADDFLGVADDTRGPGAVVGGGSGGGGVAKAGDKVVMTDMKDHMKHARKVAETMRVSIIWSSSSAVCFLGGKQKTPSSAFSSDSPKILPSNTSFIHDSRTMERSTSPLSLSRSLFSRARTC